MSQQRSWDCLKSGKKDIRKKGVYLLGMNGKKVCEACANAIRAEQKQAEKGQSVFEMKSHFITGLAVISEAKMAHTIIVPDSKTGEDKDVPACNFIAGVIETGHDLESKMGKLEFYTWLDRFLRSTVEEKQSMWANDGEW